MTASAMVPLDPGPGAPGRPIALPIRAASGIADRDRRCPAPSVRRVERTGYRLVRVGGLGRSDTGHVRLLTYGYAIRARFRNSFTRPEPLRPGEVAR
jgi:hypothetical protein